MIGWLSKIDCPLFNKEFQVEIVGTDLEVGVSSDRVLTACINLRLNNTRCEESPIRRLFLGCY